MKKTIYIIMLIFSVFSYFFAQSIITDEQATGEIKEIIKIIKANPNWLREKPICHSLLVPKVEKEVTFMAEGCENKPNKCFKSCKSGDGNSCYALALLIQIKTDISNEATNPLFSRACKLGIVSGCTNRAAFDIENAYTNKKKAKCVADTFEKTCQMNDSWGCTMYGMMLIEGVGREKNLDEAIINLNKACLKFGLKSESCQAALRLKNEIEVIKKNNPK